MTTPTCLAHPDLTHAVPQKSVGPIEISTSISPDARTNQEPLGIELPNPNLKLYQNGLGDYASYNLFVPGVQGVKRTAQLPEPSFYQRPTRRPWDLSLQQFAVQINKRTAIYFTYVLGVYALVYPFVPKPNQTISTGPRPGFGLTSSYGAALPGPKKDWSFAQ